MFVPCEQNSPPPRDIRNECHRDTDVVTHASVFHALPVILPTPCSSLVIFLFASADPFFPEAGGSIGAEATDPMAAAAPAGYVDAGSPPPVAYSMPEPAAYDLGAAGGGGDEQFGGGDQFSGGGGGEQLGGGGAEDQFSGMPLQVGWQLAKSHLVMYDVLV